MFVPKRNGSQKLPTIASEPARSLVHSHVDCQILPQGLSPLRRCSAVLTENSVRSENAEVMIVRGIMIASTMSSVLIALFALVASSFRARAAAFASSPPTDSPNATESCLRVCSKQKSNRG